LKVVAHSQSCIVSMQNLILRWVPIDQDVKEKQVGKSIFGDAPNSLHSTSSINVWVRNLKPKYL
jgi:hypothetical protein